MKEEKKMNKIKIERFKQLQVLLRLYEDYKKEEQHLIEEYENASSEQERTEKWNAQASFHNDYINPLRELLRRAYFIPNPEEGIKRYGRNVLNI